MEAIDEHRDNPSMAEEEFGKRLTESGMVRVVVFDDHVLMRTGLQPMLALVPFVHVVGVAATVEDVHQILIRESTDVLILPSGDAASARDAFLLARPFGVRTLVLARSEAPEHLNETLRAQATGQLIGTAFDAEHIAGALRQVVGLPPLAPAEDAKLRTRSTHVAGPPKDLLTPREQKILILVVEGRPDREIARELEIKPNSAKKAVAIVRAKLRCRNRAELVACALQEGWLPRPSTPEPRFVLSVDSVASPGPRPQVRKRL